MEDFELLKYMPNADSSGIPLDTIDFQLGYGEVFSEMASVAINVSGNPSGENAPGVLIANKNFLLIDDSGDGSKQLVATITPAGGDPVSILWTAPGGSGITFDDATIADPVVSIAGAAVDDSYTLTLTVTGTVSGLVTEQSVLLTAKTAMPEISAVLNAGESTAAEKVYDVTVSGGIENGTVVIGIDGYFAANNRYAVIDTESSVTPPLATEAYKKFDITKTFDASGTINFKVKLVDVDESGVIELNLTLKTVSAGMIIGDNYEIVLE